MLKSIIIVSILILILNVDYLYYFFWFPFYLKIGIIFYKKIIISDKETIEFYKYLLFNYIEELNQTQDIIYKKINENTIGFKTKFLLRYLFFNEKFLKLIYGKIHIDEKNGKITQYGFLNFYFIEILIVGIVILFAIIPEILLEKSQILFFIILIVLSIFACFIFLKFILKRKKNILISEYERIIYFLNKGKKPQKTSALSALSAVSPF